MPSAPASMASSRLMYAMPLVKWLWTQTGIVSALLERGHQVVRVARREQPGHVLDAEAVRAHVLDDPRLRDEVVEVKTGPPSRGSVSE